MPEVPETALTAEILTKYLKGKMLKSIEFASGRYQRQRPNGWKQFAKHSPMKVIKIDSKGKFIYFDLIDSKQEHWYIFNTLGLTGLWSFYPTDFTRAVFTFNKGVKVYFSDMRNFGTFRFTNDTSELEKKLEKLTPDFLKEDFDLEGIREIRQPLVKILMDQTRVGSGLGNYLVAEILYRAKISPHRLGSQLSTKDVKNLIYWIKYVTKLAYVDNHIGYMVNLEEESKKIPRQNYHPEIELKKGDTFKFLVYRKKSDPKGNPVKAEKIISGRKTYWVPAVQS